jgi:hypothetical protein
VLRIGTDLNSSSPCSLRLPLRSLRVKAVHAETAEEDAEIAELRIISLDTVTAKTIFVEKREET